MTRRELIVMVGALAPALAATGRAQQAQIRRVGALMPFPEADPVMQASVRAFTGALAHLGWVPGRNLRIDFRFAAGDPALFRAYAADLIGLAPDAILASSTAAIEAARQQTNTIPIVFVLVVDPVSQGFVRSIAHPAGNVTGFSFYDAQLMSKWLQPLKEVVSKVTRVAVIFNPDTAPFADLFSDAIEAAAPSFEMTVTRAPVRDDVAIEAAVAAEAREPGGSLIDLPESFSVTHRDTIIAAASRHRLPLMGATELFPRAGELMS